jgi:hypothetical protein
LEPLCQSRKQLKSSETVLFLNPQHLKDMKIENCGHRSRKDYTNVEKQEESWRKSYFMMGDGSQQRIIKTRDSQTFLPKYP